MADLEQRYRALSRQFHPDYFYNASAAERRQSLERSSYLNDAYRALKNPVGRVEYLLKIEGVTQSTDGSQQGGHNPKVPASLLEEVFALNEELDEIRELKAGGAPPAEWQARLGDEVFEGPDGAKIFVDKKSLLYLNGTVLEYDTSLLGKGFVFNNPNAKTTCGCGSSFGA